MPGMQGMDANLVGPAGNRPGLNQGGKVTEAAQDLEHGHRLLALLLVDLDHTLAGTQIALAQRRADLLDRSRPVTTDQRHIALVDAVALSKILGRSPATIRSWANRYPDMLPRLGRDQRGRTLYSYRDAIELRDTLDGRLLANAADACNTSGQVGQLRPDLDM